MVVVQCVENSFADVYKRQLEQLADLVEDDNGTALHVVAPVSYTHLSTCAKSFCRRRRCMLAEGGLRII